MKKTILNPGAASENARRVAGGKKNLNGGKDRRGYMKGYIYVTLNEKELVLIPVQNIEYIGYDDMGYHVLICLSVGRRREFSVKESIDEIKERLLEAIKP